MQLPSLKKKKKYCLTDSPPPELILLTHVHAVKRLWRHVVAVTLNMAAIQREQRMLKRLRPPR